MEETSNGRLCSKCEVNPANKGHDWCSQCKLEQQKRAEADRDEMLVRRGFQRGILAMRQAVIRSLESIGPGALLSPSIVVNLVRQQESPQWD